MTRVLTAFFEDYKAAASVVRQLEDAGFSYREVSVICTAPTFSRDSDWKWTDPGRERELHARYGVDYMGH